MWANQLDIPVFSVDYRLSPLSHFPDALNDCWQVYTWLVEEGEKNLGIKINHIILAGDSAGGNLITSLTALLIKKNYSKLPLSLIMSYPAQYTGLAKFVPSILLSLDDILLPFKFLREVMSAYQGNIAELNPDCNSETNDLMSPLLIDPQVLAKFPQTLIQASQNCPLRDFGIIFAIKLRKSGAQVIL